MTKPSSIFLLMLFLVMFASARSLVKADTCSEGLGACTGAGQDCDAKCKARHGPSAQGSCDHTFSPGLCTCFYSCGGPPAPPPPKKCIDGLGVCTASCGDQCCNQKCVSKHPGGEGYCDNIGAIYLCQCQYTC